MPAGDIDRPMASSKYQESVSHRLLDRNHLWWRVCLVQVGLSKETLRTGG